jgi:SNF5 / SMARCB1 / INI1
MALEKKKKKKNLVMMYSERLVPIKLEMEIRGENVTDSLVWDLDDDDYRPEDFARVYCTELDIPEHLESVVANSVKRQLADAARVYKRLPRRTTTSTDSLQSFDENRNENENEQNEQNDDDDDDNENSVRDGGEREQCGECIRVISLDISLGKLRLRDRFEWDIQAAENSPEVFARQLVTDLALPRGFESAVAFSIRWQILLYQKAWIDSVTRRRATSFFDSGAERSADAVVRSTNDVLRWTPVVEDAEAPRQSIFVRPNNDDVFDDDVADDIDLKQKENVTDRSNRVGDDDNDNDNDNDDFDDNDNNNDSDEGKDQDFKAPVKPSPLFASAMASDNVRQSRYARRYGNVVEPDRFKSSSSVAQALARNSFASADLAPRIVHRNFYLDHRAFPGGRSTDKAIDIWANPPPDNLSENSLVPIVRARPLELPRDNRTESDDDNDDDDDEVIAIGNKRAAPLSSPKGSESKLQRVK